MPKLVLSRRPNEEIWIGDPEGDHIVVRVSTCNAQRAILSIEAPEDVGVHRREVAERINGTKPVGPLRGRDVSKGPIPAS